MSQIESAVPTKLDLVGHHLNGHKLRVAGKVLCYDPTSALLLLVDKETALLIDVSLCVDRWSGPWLRERLATAMVMGHIEILEKQLPIPTLPAFAPAPSVDPQPFGTIPWTVATMLSSHLLIILASPYDTTSKA
ncbi:hypothetical protein AB1N83_004284 [Pleurotus pulmonarius]